MLNRFKYGKFFEIIFILNHSMLNHYNYHKKIKRFFLFHNQNRFRTQLATLTQVLIVFCSVVVIQHGRRQKTVSFEIVTIVQGESSSNARIVIDCSRLRGFCKKLQEQIAVIGGCNITEIYRLLYQISAMQSLHCKQQSKNGFHTFCLNCFSIPECQLDV